MVLKFAGKDHPDQRLGAAPGRHYFGGDYLQCASGNTGHLSMTPARSPSVGHQQGGITSKQFWQSNVLGEGFLNTIVPWDGHNYATGYPGQCPEDGDGRPRSRTSPPTPPWQYSTPSSTPGPELRRWRTSSPSSSRNLQSTSRRRGCVRPIDRH